MSSSHTHCHAHMVVGHVYRSVINDTIAAVRSYFLDEGVDEQVLQELKQLWESKLTQSRAVPGENETLVGGAISGAPPTSGSMGGASGVNATPPKPRPPYKPVGSTVSQQQYSQQQQQQLVPIQITIPPQGQSGESKTIIVQVPVSAVQSGLAGQYLQTILSSPAAQATFALPPDVAGQVLQRQLNDALRATAAAAGNNNGGQAVLVSGGGGGAAAAAVAPSIGALACQMDGCDDKSVNTFGGGSSVLFSSAAFRLECLSPLPTDGVVAVRRKRTVLQLDGACDTSDSDDEDGDEGNDPEDDDEDPDMDDRDDDEDELDDEEDDVDGEGREEEPLNSEDDVSDHEPVDLNETENVMVCQFDKITRIRNKWKFHLKDGIMNVDGKDYIFQKANGDAEW